MIEQFYPSKKRIAVENKKPSHSVTVMGEYNEELAKARGLTLVEFLRRDAIVKKLANEFPHKVGDTVYPSLIKEYEKHGALLVMNVARKYKDMEKEEWPKNDNPMIIVCKSLSDNSTLFCTSNYLTKKSPLNCDC